MSDTDTLYEFPSQLFRAHAAETPSEYARRIYKATDCGAWTSFVLADGSTIPSADLEPYQDTVAYASRHFVGVQHGTIVEGSDAEFVCHPLLFPFAATDLQECFGYLEAESDAAWKEANEDVPEMDFGKQAEGRAE